MEHANLKQSETSYDEPFREPLSDSDLAHTIKKLSSNPDKLVREWDFKKQYQSIEDARKGIEMFRKMEGLYGIAIPKMDLLVGKANDRIKLFTVLDKIEGENLANIAVFSPEDKDESDKFFTALAQFYFDVYQKGGEYWWDFGLRQLVYGHKKGEPGNRVYIVDVEPRYYVHDKANPKNADVLDYLSRIAADITLLESRFKNKILLQNSRALLLKIAKDLKSGIENNYARGIKGYLKI